MGRVASFIPNWLRPEQTVFRALRQLPRSPRLRASFSVIGERGFFILATINHAHLAHDWTGKRLRNPTKATRPSAVVDTRVIYCGDNMDQLKKLPDGCVDLVAIDPPFNSNRNYEVFWGETKEKRAFEDRHASTQAYIEFMRPRCVELHRVLTVPKRKPLPPRHQDTKGCLLWALLVTLCLCGSLFQSF